MMTQRYYKVLFQSNGTGSYDTLSSKVARSIEEIIVEQEMDLAWQSRIKLRINADDKGNWTEEHRELMKPFARVRVEIGNGTQPYIPLIDGPVVGHDISMSSEPGDSFATLKIEDDSVFLNQTQEFGMFEGKSIPEIVQKCFKVAEDKITPMYLETKIIRNSSFTMQRGTPMELLRELGKKHGIHAYVLPGHQNGKSVGCFQTLKSHERIQGSLPNNGRYAPLILLGRERNIESFDARTDGQSPSNVYSVSFSPDGKNIVSRTTEPKSLDLIGNRIGYESSISPPVRLLPAYAVGPVDENNSDAEIAERLNYAIEATGSVNTEVYSNILQPYSSIHVRGVGPEYSGEYLITGVTHTITPAKYSQTFKLKGSALAGS